MRNVLLSGGIYHPFADTSDWLVQRFANQGVESVITEDVGEAVSELHNADCLTVNALRWRMLNDPKYAEHRKRWAFDMPEDWAQRITEFVEQGGALLALHTASICFDSWYGYGALLGGRWVWQRSHHPEPGRCLIRTAGEHAIVSATADLPSEHASQDEVYHRLELASDSVPLLQARTEPATPGVVDEETGIGAWQTVAWCREEGAGRIVYCALGHDRQALETPAVTQFLDRSMRWLLDEL
ncbi:MAG: ThuA domain-containing protein [Pseudomonadales bacterium]